MGKVTSFYLIICGDLIICKPIAVLILMERTPSLQLTDPDPKSEYRK